MKAKKSIPKYGLIYNASIVGSAKAQLKGKISRTLANKCALCVRYDALGEDVEGNMGLKNRAYIEGRAKLLEAGGKVVRPKQAGAGAAGGLPSGKPNPVQDSMQKTILLLSLRKSVRRSNEI